MDQNQVGNPEVKTVKVLVGLPKDGKTEPKAYDNRMEMLFHLGVLQTVSQLGLDESMGVKFDIPKNVKFQFHLSTIGRVFTALARERIAEGVLDMGFDYLFMIDDDMIAPQDLFERLYRHNVDIVAPLAFTRLPPHKPVLYRIKTGYDSVEHKDYYINYSVLDYPKDTLVEVDAVGFGAVLIKADVFKTLKKPWFMTTSGAGEDIHFCWQATKNGKKVFMDTATKLGHLSDPKEITEEVFLSQENTKSIMEAK
jgi:hypothetical protein